MPPEVPAHVVRVTVRIRDANWAHSRLPRVELTHVANQVSSRQIGHVAERALVGATVDMRPDLVLGHHSCRNVRILQLLTRLALLNVPFNFCELDDLLAWSLHV